MINSFLKFKFCVPCAAFVQNSSHVSGENAGTICYKQKFEEPTSKTEISGKNKYDKTLKKDYNITHFANKFVSIDVLCPHLKLHDYNGYITL